MMPTTPQIIVARNLLSSSSLKMFTTAIPEEYAFPVFVVHVASIKTINPMIGNPISANITVISWLPEQMANRVPQTSAPTPAGITPVTHAIPACFPVFQYLV